MNAVPPLSLSWLVVAGVALLAGLWLLRRGWRGRCVGDEPTCKRCGYSLVGLERTRCPECGADVSVERGVTIGTRVRLWKRAASGAALSISALIFLSTTGWQRLRVFDWYSLKPTGYVIDDLGMPDYGTAERAWRELLRREKVDGPLPRRHYDRLVAYVSSTWFGDSPYKLKFMDFEFGPWLQQEATAGRLNDEQKRSFYEDASVFSLGLRATVIEGDDVPGRIRCSTRFKNSDLKPALRARVTEISLSVDGGPFNSIERSTDGRGIDYEFGFPVSVSVRKRGRHDLAFRLHVAVIAHLGRLGSPEHENEQRLKHAYDVTLSGITQVVADAPEYRIQRVLNDPALEAKVRRAIRLQGFSLNVGEHPFLFGELSADFPPVGLAFAVFARVQGTEYPLGGFTQPVSGFGHMPDFEVRGYYDGPLDVEKIDLIFRPDEAAARCTVELTEIWGSTLEFKDVPVRVNR